MGRYLQYDLSYRRKFLQYLVDVRPQLGLRHPAPCEEVPQLVVQPALNVDVANRASRPLACLHANKHLGRAADVREGVLARHQL